MKKRFFGKYRLHKGES